MLWRVKLREKEAGLPTSQRSTDASGEPRKHQNNAMQGDGKKKKKQKQSNDDNNTAREAAIAYYRQQQRLQKQRQKQKTQNGL